MISTISRRYSLDEYRAIEEKAEGRSEYRDGEIVPMPGGTLDSVNIELPMAEIYRGVVFE